MQVKKFEARSMKEALEMVKLHLGPEAIILAARDHNKGFGLVGQTSVEVTAAVSEETLRKKLLAEKKMNQEIRAKFNNSPARIQKKFIDKAFFVGMEDVMRRPITAIPYIDIGDEGEEAAASREAQVAVPKPPVIDEEVAAQRIRSAVKSALSAGLATMEEKSLPGRFEPKRPPRQKLVGVTLLS